MKIDQKYLGDYIQGKFRAVNDPNGEITSVNPGDLSSPSITFPFKFDHVNEAVNAARRSFLSWKRMPLSDRFSAISRYRDLLEKKIDVLSQTISYEIGKPLWESKQEISETVTFIDYFLKDTQCLSNVDTDDSQNKSRGTIRFFPRGVIGVLSSTDLPIFGTHRLLIPAMGFGNTLVIKSNKYAPASCQLVAQIFHEAGLPAGVYNLVHGGFEIGRRIATHPDVNGFFFTGNYEKGQKLKKQIVSHYNKLLVYETGGKNGILIWKDSQYEKALYETFCSVFLTSGQRHTCARRVFIHDEWFDRFVSDFHKLSKEVRIGYAFSSDDKEPFMGPLLSEKSVENYLRYQGIAVREGCEELMRGKSLERKQRGFYVSPSIHIVEKPNPDSVYEKSEFFGPNVAFYRIEDLDEAAELMNQTQYGMVASIYSSERKNYHRMVETVKVGCLYWNVPTTIISNTLPMGGLKKSGNAHPMGTFAKYQCTYPVSSLESLEPESTFSTPPSMPKLK